MSKERQSNFELCRLASILLVMLVHSVWEPYENEVSLGVNLLKAFSIIGVNVFILITGFFSATPKKTSLVNIVFICFFWMIIKVGVRFFLGEDVDYKYAFFITSSNWFIASYIVLLFLTPILNTFCDSVNKKVLWGVVITLLFVEIWFDWLPPHPKVPIGTQSGYSVFSFMILYLLARTIRLYGLPEWFKRISPIIYIACSLTVGCLGYVFQLKGLDGGVMMLYAYSSPIVILSSVAFLLSFEKISIHSKFINHIAKSTLAVLFGHSAIFFLYTKQFQYIFDSFSGIQLICYWVLFVGIVFVASILIDQLRILLWKPISNYLKTHIKSDLIFQ